MDTVKSLSHMFIVTGKFYQKKKGCLKYILSKSLEKKIINLSVAKWRVANIDSNISENKSSTAIKVENTKIWA